MQWQLHTCYAIGQLNEQHSTGCYRTAPNGKYASSLDTSPDYLMPAGGLSSSTAGGTRSGKHFSTRPELVVDGRTLGACQLTCAVVHERRGRPPPFRHLRYWADVLVWASSQMYTWVLTVQCCKTLRTYSTTHAGAHELSAASAAGFLLGTPAEKQLAAVAAGCASVIVCRASPSQKAAVVRMMMEYEVSLDP